MHIFFSKWYQFIKECSKVWTASLIPYYFFNIKIIIICKLTNNNAAFNKLFLFQLKTLVNIILPLVYLYEALMINKLVARYLNLYFFKMWIFVLKNEHLLIILIGGEGIWIALNLYYWTTKIIIRYNYWRKN